MSNLLDRSSIVLTPTAYDNGKVLCVKPSDGSGDFDFSRNSAATRVNAQGLVEDVQILSSNLVQNGSFSEQGVQEVSNGSFSQEGSQLITNGDFSNGSTDWTITRGNVINNKLVFNTTGAPSGSRSVLAIQSNIADLTKVYKVQFTISNYVSGQFRLRQPFITTDTFGNGTYTYYGTANDSGFYLQGRFDIEHNFSIDNCSVVEVGQDWTIEDTWTIGDGVANGNGANGTSEELIQSSVFSVGKTYSVTYEVKNYVSGSIGTRLNVTTPRSANGVYTQFIVANSTILIFNPTNFNGSVTNISVKEVGQNWTFPNDWEVGNNKIIGLGSGFGGLQQTISLQNKKIKVTFDILDYVSGTFRVPPTYRQDGLDERFSGNGSYEVIYTSLVDFFSFQPQLFDGSITNISAIEITDDTNLPRINYEGFSYQDALGSEQVTNGGFSSDLSGWSSITNVSWSSNFGGSAFMNANGTNAQFRQFITYVVGKTYRISWEVKENNGCDLFRVYNNGVFTNITDNFVGTHTIDFTQTSGTLFVLRNDKIGSNITIDNISVKEVTGQEVVPDSGCGSWLWENQSTNVIEYSNDYADSYWQKLTSGSGVVPIITSNYAISPDGTQNADRIQFDASTSGSSSDRSRIRATLTLTDNADYTFSFYAKSTNGTDQKISILFDNSQISVKTITSEWQRYEATSTQTGTGSFCGLDLRSNNASTSDILVYGIQIEEQSFSTSLIPTDGTSVTRNKDVCTNGGSAASINSTEGVLYAQIASLTNNDTSARYLGTSDGTSQNRVVILYYSAINKVRAIVSSGGTKFVDVNFAVTSLSDFHKVAIKYKANDFAFWVDGVEVATDTTGNAPIGLDRLSFNLANANDFFGKTKAVAVWKEALTDLELQKLTTI